MSRGVDVTFSGLTTVGAVLDDARRFAVQASDQLWDLAAIAGDCAACAPLPLASFSYAWADPLTTLSALLDELGERVRTSAGAYAQVDADAAYRFGAVPDAGA
jgi:hypothetical protein